MDPDGSNLKDLTDGMYDADPSWSPDGKRIAFTSTRAGDGFRLFAMDADGKNVTPITTEGNNNGFVYPAWSPDGKKVAYAHPAAGGLELFVVGIDGKNNKQSDERGGIELVRDLVQGWEAVGVRALQRAEERR